MSNNFCKFYTFDLYFYFYADLEIISIFITKLEIVIWHKEIDN